MFNLVGVRGVHPHSHLVEPFDRRRIAAGLECNGSESEGDLEEGEDRWQLVR